MDETWLLPETGDHAQPKKFAPEEMVTCEACLRANPPTRSECMYCGAPLQRTEASSTPGAEAPVEENTPGYYVVLRASTNTATDDSVLEQLATRFRMKPDELRAAFATGTPLPLAAYASHDE